MLKQFVSWQRFRYREALLLALIMGCNNAAANSNDAVALELAECGAFYFVLAELFPEAESSVEVEMSKRIAVAYIRLSESYLPASIRVDDSSDSIKHAATSMSSIAAALEDDFLGTMDKWRSTCKQYATDIEKIAFLDESYSTRPFAHIGDTESWVLLGVHYGPSSPFVNSLSRYIFPDKIECQRSVMGVSQELKKAKEIEEALALFCIPPNIGSNYSDVKIGDKKWVMMQINERKGLGVEAINFYELDSQEACVLNLKLVTDFTSKQSEELTVFAVCMPPDNKVTYGPENVDADAIYKKLINRRTAPPINDRSLSANDESKENLTEVWVADKSIRLASSVSDESERKIILSQVYREAQRVDLPPELILAVIEIESAFDRFAVAPDGSLGLMQIKPYWLAEIGLPGDNLLEVSTNLRYGCTILKYYIDDEEGELKRALARFNDAPGYANKVINALVTNWSSE